MPLLLISGGPSSGKTTVGGRIAKYFESRGFHAVEIISDECNGNFSRRIYNDSNKVCFVTAIFANLLFRTDIKHLYLNI